jgi:RNA polymerase sigma-70 factor (ECF subfamily)
VELTREQVETQANDPKRFIASKIAPHGAKCPPFPPSIDDDEASVIKDDGITMSEQDITQLIAQVRKGDEAASEDLFRRVYRELRHLAAYYMRSERRDHTLQPTALVHEAYLRLIDQRDLPGESRAHFFGVAASVMRRILIDHARAHRADKRGGRDVKVPLDEAPALAAENLGYLIEVDQALERLAVLDPRQARIVELRFFGGLSIEEIANILDIGPRTVDRDWRLAKAWLRSELE